MSAIKDIILNAGETIGQEFATTLLASTGSLTGWSAKLRVCEFQGSAVILASTSTDQLTIARNKVTLTVPASASAVLYPGVFQYQLELKSSGGVVTRTHEGKCTITPRLVQ